MQIQHQYRLTNEQGPAHKKRFTVTLKLGDEEYAAEGASIKKAQHSAASEALEHTQYKHPPPKTQRNIRLGKSKLRQSLVVVAFLLCHDFFHFTFVVM
jgi:double-stranded RNA-binding protein Staufen